MAGNERARSFGRFSVVCNETGPVVMRTGVQLEVKSATGSLNERRRIVFGG